MTLPFTMQSALEASRRNQLEAWIHAFLNGEGNNPAFSEGLRLEPRRYHGPHVFPLAGLTRCTGPEPGMKYPVDPEGFEQRVKRIQTAWSAGFDLPPLIVNFSRGVLEVNDGNHRLEALRRSGATEFGIIVWTTGQKDGREAERFLDSRS